MSRRFDAVCGNSSAETSGPSRRWRLILGLAGSLALAAYPGLAQAAAAEEQQTDEQKADGQAAEEESAVRSDAGEEITVTARRREEDVQEVPVAVTVKSAEVLEDNATQDISELQETVPNLAIYAGRNQSTTLTVFMRGIGQADPLWGVDPGVGLYMDDVYMARPQGALLDVYDVERIEVLRGPQGTLYGKNTIGGAIKYVSRGLGDELDGAITLIGGNYDNLDVRASVGGAIVPGKLRGRIALASMQRDGYGENVYLGHDVSDKDSQAGRLSFDWLPADNVRLAFSYDQSRDRANPKSITRLRANPLCPALLGRPCPPTETFDTESGMNPVNSTDAEGYSLNASWELSPAWTLRSITAHRESDSENTIDFDTTPARIVDVFATYYDEQFSEELQAVYDAGGKLSGVGGLYYFDGEAGGLVKNIFANALFGTTDGNVETESFAAFADGTYRLTDALSIDGGVRFTREKKTAHVNNLGYRDDTFSQVTSVAARFDKSKTFDSFAPRLGLNYRFNEDVMGYVSVSRGFKSGGYNIRANTVTAPGSDQPFDDEVLDVAEVGVKSVLFDHNLVLNGAVFYGDYKDVQVSTFTEAGGQFFGQFLNAGDAVMTGAELEWNALSLGASWFGASGQVSYLHADVETLDNNRDGFVDTQVITNAPEWTASLTPNVHFGAFGGVLNASFTVAYRDDAVLTNEGGQFPANSGRALLPISQEAYTLFDAQIGWLSPDAHWRFGINGKNLGDEEYLTNGYNIPSLGIYQGAYGNPRTVLGTIEYKF